MAGVFAGDQQTTDGDGAGLEFVEGARDLAGVAGEFGLDGHDVGGSEGEEAERDRGADHAVEDFVESAVATGGEDEVGTAGDALLRDSSGGHRAGGGPDVEFRAMRAKRFECLAKPAGVTEDLARVRIIDNGDLTITCDATNPRLRC
jgi:hypothetical protein